MSAIPNPLECDTCHTRSPVTLRQVPGLFNGRRVGGQTSSRKGWQMLMQERLAERIATGAAEWSETKAEIDRRRKSSMDFLMGPAGMAVANAPLGARMHSLPEGEGEGQWLRLDNPGSWQREFLMTPNAHAQLATHLRIPLSFYHRLLKGHKDLWHMTINTLIQRDGSERLVRTTDDKVHAILSDKYRVCLLYTSDAADE